MNTEEYPTRDATWAEEIRIELGLRYGPVGPYLIDRLWARAPGAFLDLSLRWLARDAFTDHESARAIVEDASDLGLLTIIDESQGGLHGLIDPAWGARPAGSRLPIVRANHGIQVRELVMRRADFTCKLCGHYQHPDEPYDGSYAPGSGGFQLQLDHIVPLARGGTDHIDNLQVLCRACNMAKGVKQ